MLGMLGKSNIVSVVWLIFGQHGVMQLLGKYFIASENVHLQVAVIVKPSKVVEV